MYETRHVFGKMSVESQHMHICIERERYKRMIFILLCFFFIHSTYNFKVNQKTQTNYI